MNKDKLIKIITTAIIFLIMNVMIAIFTMLLNTAINVMSALMINQLGMNMYASFAVANLIISAIITILLFFRIDIQIDKDKDKTKIIKR